MTKSALLFGKYEGQPVVEVIRNNPGYFDWMMKSDFPNDQRTSTDTDEAW